MVLLGFPSVLLDFPLNLLGFPLVLFGFPLVLLCYPMVLLEALARRRPVVIFDEIKHVIGDKKGIFVTKRNFLSFIGTLNNIKKN